MAEQKKPGPEQDTDANIPAEAGTNDAAAETDASKKREEEVVGAADEVTSKDSGSEDATPVEDHDGEAGQEEPVPTALAEANKALSDVSETETETETEAANEAVEAVPAEPQVSPAPQQVIVKRGGIVPGFIGGAVAGIGAALLLGSGMVNDVLPENLRGADHGEAVQVNATAIDELRGAQQSNVDGLAALGERVKAVDDRVSALKIPDTGPLETATENLSSKLEAISAALDKLAAMSDEMDDRLTAVEKRPIDEGLSEEAIAAYERELAKLQQSMVDQQSEIAAFIEAQRDAVADAMAEERAQIEALLEEARKLENAAQEQRNAAAIAERYAGAQTALALIGQAIVTGTPFDAHLAALTSAGLEVPNGLVAAATEGVATLAILREEFPPAARAALNAAREGDEDRSGGLWAFIQRELGARSVTPREGDDADAVLSRAEAALKADDLAKTLEELAALPEFAQAPLADWIALAQTRLAAVEGAEAVAGQLNTN